MFSFVILGDKLMLEIHLTQPGTIQMEHMDDLPKTKEPIKRFEKQEVKDTNIKAHKKSHDFRDGFLMKILSICLD